MFSKRILFVISILSAILMISLGSIMKYFTDNSQGFIYSRSGGALVNSLNPNGIIGIGFLVLLLSVWAYAESIKFGKQRMKELTKELTKESGHQLKIQKRMAKVNYLKRFGGRGNK